MSQKDPAPTHRGARAPTPGPLLLTRLLLTRLLLTRLLLTPLLLTRLLLTPLLLTRLLLTPLLLTRLLLTPLLLGALALAGCALEPAPGTGTGTGTGTGSGSDPAVGQLQRPIYNGQPDTDPAHAAVVALVEDVGGGQDEAFCTGILIGVDVVLTAAHCLDDLQPTALRIFFGEDVTAGGSQVGVDELLQHDGWNADDPGSPDDIGLVFLATPAPDWVTPIPPLPSARRLTDADLDTALVFSGFGETEELSYDVKLWVEVPLGQLCEGPSSCPWSGDILVPRSFAYLQDDGGPCVGDSGGPALLSRGGTEYVVGITAYGDMSCWGLGVSTLVDAYEGWIAENAGLAEGEICDQEGDEDGDGRADCDDPECANAAPCADSGCQQSGHLPGGPALPAWLLLTLLALLALLARGARRARRHGR